MFVFRYAATPPTAITRITNAALVAADTMGSIGLTAYTSDDSVPASAALEASPAASAATDTSVNGRSTSATIDPRDPPSAIRMAISRDRCATLNVVML